MVTVFKSLGFLYELVSMEHEKGKDCVFNPSHLHPYSCLIFLPGCRLTCVDFLIRGMLLKRGMVNREWGIGNEEWGMGNEYVRKCFMP